MSDNRLSFSSIHKCDAGWGIKEIKPSTIMTTYVRPVYPPTQPGSQIHTQAHIVELYCPKRNASNCYQNSAIIG